MGVNQANFEKLKKNRGTRGYPYKGMGKSKEKMGKNNKKGPREHFFNRKGILLT